MEPCVKCLVVITRRPRCWRDGTDGPLRFGLHPEPVYCYLKRDQPDEGPAWMCVEVTIYSTSLGIRGLEEKTLESTGQLENEAGD